jgi:N utilization substance protein A
MEVVVEDKQLSLAIGKKGQNVRLGAKLTGWRIDIKSEEEKRKEVEAQFGALEAGDAQAQMDALFPDTPQVEQEPAPADVSADLSAEADEQTQSAEAEAIEESESGEVAEAESTEVVESAASVETEKLES